MTAKRSRIPRWVWPTIVAVIGLILLIWTFTLSGITQPAASALVGVCTPIATVLVVVLQRTHRVEHELTPNSGSSTKDQINRMEKMLATVLLDVGGIRVENRDDRRATEARFALIENRVHELEHPKEKP